MGTAEEQTYDEGDGDEEEKEEEEEDGKDMGLGLISLGEERTKLWI